MKTKTKRDEVLKILCLEDSQKDVEIMHELLVDAGYKITIDCTDKEKEYVSFLRSKKYDLILSDFKLPGFDGFKALKWAVEICPDVPFICVSGTVGEEIAVELLKQGAVDYVLKNHLEKLPIAMDRALREMKEKKARLEAEKELIISAEKWKTTFDSISDIICIISTDHEIIDINKAGCNYFGMDRNDIIGSKCFELMHRSNSPISGCPCPLALNTKEKGTTEIVENDRYYQSSVWPVLNKKSEVIAFSHNISDITERKQKEEELLFRNAILSTQQEASIDGIMVVDKDSNIISYNNKFMEIWGISPELLENKGSGPFLKLVANKVGDTKSFLQQVQYLNEHKQEKSRDDIVFKDGRIFDRYSAPMLDKGSKYYGRVWYFRDITERKLAEEIIEKERALLITLIDNLPSAVFVKDKDYRKVVANAIHLSSIAGHLSNLGLGSKTDFIGKTDFEVYPKELAEKFFADDQKVIQDGYVQINKEEEGISPDGKKIWLLVSKIPLRDSKGVINGLIGITTDITERKLAEEKLAYEQFLLQSIMDNIPDSIYFKDRESRFIRINSALALKHGLKNTAEAIGKTDFDFFSDEHARQAYEDEQEIIRTGQIINKEEKETWPDRPDTWVSTTKLPLHDKKGNIVGTFGISKDITVRKEIELMLIQKNQEIEMQNEEYKQINEELYKAKEHAEESDRLKTAFLQNMSHEIRTPMNGILGFAELLKSPRLSGEKQQQFIQLIEQSGQRMLNIINDIVNISKIETGQFELELKETNLNRLLLHLNTFFKPEAEGKGLNLSFKTGLSDELCKIETDDTKLTQVLSNLIKNALKFTKSGTIEFGYNIVGTQHVAPTVEFYVKDTGIGITPEMHNIIFERFRQVDMTTARNYEGAGLGLAISKAFVEKLGGKIWVESELGMGATFYFNIPYSSISKGDVEIHLEAKEEGQLQFVNILIAEDDDICMMFLKELLETENATLYCANNGREALDIVKTKPEINLVLMDLKMPVMDGFEATKLIKRIKPGLPVIAQSAYAFSNDQDKARIAGCDDFIGKPLKREMLLSMIKKHLIIH